MAHNGHAYIRNNRHNLASCLREIFTASFWKKAHEQFAEFEKDRTRWSLPMCWYTGLFMTLDSATAEQDRFDGAREVVTALFEKRRRCGATLSGFTQALAGLPCEFFSTIRMRLQHVLGDLAVQPGRMSRWQAFGLDGSHEDVPRTVAHEQYYGVVTKGTRAGAGTAQRLLVTAVGLARHVLWDWESDSALGSERDLALHLIRRLPLGALGVVDAGFIGYEWGLAVKASGRHFLARVGGNARLWAETLPNAEWRDGEVWLWPDYAQDKKGLPLVLRLIRLELCSRKHPHKPEVMWLVTDVLEPDLLTCKEAAHFYRKRWPASECTFRTWKKEMAAEKLVSRTPLLAEREAEFSLCTLMLLQTSVYWARHQKRQRRSASVAQAKRVWRKATRALLRGKPNMGFKIKLGACRVDAYRRRHSKASRPWPERKEHRQLKRPDFRKLGKRRKVCGLMLLAEETKRAS
jgi:hypothetical protein